MDDPHLAERVRRDLCWWLRPMFLAVEVAFIIAFFLVKAIPLLTKDAQYLTKSDNFRTDIGLLCLAGAVFYPVLFAVWDKNKHRVR